MGKLYTIMELETLTIEQVLDEFFHHCHHELKLNEKTVSAYKVDLRQFAEKIGQNAYAYEISRDYLKAWLGRLEIYKPRTVKRKIASARVFLHYMEEAYERYENPFRRLHVKIKQPVCLPRVMTLSEMKSILECLSREASIGGNKKLSVRNLAVVELLFGTGMRIGELCGLRNEDVDLIERRARIHGKGNRERVVDIGPIQTMEALREWVRVRQSSDAPAAWFFTNRLGNVLAPQSVRTMVHELCRRCNIGKNVTPHMFRHTFASLLLEEDVDVAYIQHILGHSSIATTQIYLHVNPRHQREILMNRHPRARL